MSIRIIVYVALAAICLLSSAVVAQPSTGGDELVFTAGIPDGFQYPSERPIPSAEFFAWLVTTWPQPITRQFDDGGGDRALVHTFRGWVGDVCGATLELRLRATNTLAVDNDTVRLELVGGGDPALGFPYVTTLRFIYGSWQAGDDRVLVLDLGNLPPYGVFPTNILETLKDGSLDLLVEDDTMVDYAMLRILPCPIRVEARSWGTLKSFYQ